MVSYLQQQGESPMITVKRIGLFLIAVLIAMLAFLTIVTAIMTTPVQAQEPTFDPGHPGTIGTAQYSWCTTLDNFAAKAQYHKAERLASGITPGSSQFSLLTFPDGSFVLFVYDGDMLVCIAAEGWLPGVDPYLPRQDI